MSLLWIDSHPSHHRLIFPRLPIRHHSLPVLMDLTIFFTNLNYLSLLLLTIFAFTMIALVIRLLMYILKHKRLPRLDHFDPKRFRGMTRLIETQLLTQFLLLPSQITTRFRSSVRNTANTGSELIWWRSRVLAKATFYNKKILTTTACSQQQHHQMSIKIEDWMLISTKNFTWNQ